MPAILGATSGGGGAVAAAFIVFLLLVLSYLAIMAFKLKRIEREVVEMAKRMERTAAGDETRAEEPVA